MKLRVAGGYRGVEWGRWEGLENMKVRVDGKVSNVMKVAAGKIYKGRERGRDGALVLSASNKPPAVRR